MSANERFIETTIRLLAVAALLAGSGGCGSGERLRLYDNQPLTHPVVVTALAKPDAVVLADGRTVRLKGVRLTTDGPLDRLHLAVFDLPTAGVEVDAPAEAGRDGLPRALTTKVAHLYFCGNTVGTLPRYGTADLGATLVAAGVAVPTTAVLADDPEYASRLADALWTRGARDRHPDPWTAGDAEAIAVGRLLLDDAFAYRPAHEGWHGRDPASHVRVAAAKLLVAAGDPEAAAHIAAAVRRTGTPARPVSGLVEILVKLDRPTAVAATLEALRSPEPPPAGDAVQGALTLALAGDWAALDEVVRRSTDAGPMGNELTGELAYAFQVQGYPFFGPSPSAGEVELPLRLAEWYESVRPRLRCGGSLKAPAWTAQPAAGGEPTARAYHESMIPFLPGVRTKVPAAPSSAH